MVAKDIVVIGASAGGIEAIRKLVSAFPPGLQAAVFITVHLFDRSDGFLPQVLTRAGPLPAIHPWDETPIEKGRIYVAPPDYHLILTPGTVQLGHGPKENMQRPCINVMFRSAAAAFGERVAGVLLTGLLDDGAAGLWEIQQRGGATIVQDPEEAAFRSMPESAIRGLNVQYIVRIAEMAPLIARLTMGDRPQSKVPDLEAQKGQDTMQSCPECGGAMKRYAKGRMKEYVCHVGHRFGLKTIIAEKSGVVERAIWTAMSQSEELSQLLEETLPELDEESAKVIREEIERRTNEQETLRGLVESELAPSLD